MKLKYNFITRDVAGQKVALALGDDNKKFNGIIKLNSVGEFIFKLLENEITYDEIMDKITEKYDVSKEDADSSVRAFIDVLRQNDALTD